MFEMVIATHGRLADAFKDTAQMIMGSTKDLKTVSLGPAGITEFSQQVAQLVKPLLTQDTLVLTDLTGGTPFNEFAKQSFQWQAQFELIGGLNLPLLIEILNYQKQGISLAQVIFKIKHLTPIEYLSDLMQDTNNKDDE